VKHNKANNVKIFRAARQPTRTTTHVSASEPLDLINFLFNLERFQVVKLWLVRLEFREEPVFSIVTLRVLVPLEKNHPTSFVAGGEVLAIVAELDSADDVSCV
jgi:hypothetical protein